MSTKATFIPGSHQSTVEQDSPQSALFYLFQEVSRLASPVHGGFADANSSPSKWLGRETSDRGAFIAEREEREDTRLFQTCVLPCNRVNAMKEESCGGGVASPLTEPHVEFNSPWRVLSLINLQCERLMYRGDVAPSESGASRAKSSPAAGERGVVFGSVENALRPSVYICQRQEIAASGGGRHKPQWLVTECELGRLVQTQPGEQTTDAVKADAAASAASSCRPRHKRDTTHGSSQARVSGEATDPSTPTLDCNANVVATARFTPVVSVEGKPSPTERPKSTSCHVASANVQPELRPVKKEEEEEEIAVTPQRTKTQRKQPHPRRSVDVHDPDVRGVTFRMGPELDDSREHCRLLITSQYSKELFKSARRRRRPRTRASRKTFKTSSSEEESDPATAASKGKVCASCCTRKTPMWRDAEDGTPLCNACGIRYKKYRVRCVNCWHIPRKDGNSNSCCLKCGNSVRKTHHNGNKH